MRDSVKNISIRLDTLEWQYIFAFTIYKNITMKNFLKFLRENKKGIIWFAVILVIAWITITIIENWNAVQEGFYEGLNG